MALHRSNSASWRRITACVFAFSLFCPTSAVFSFATLVALIPALIPGEAIAPILAVLAAMNLHQFSPPPTFVWGLPGVAFHLTPDYGTAAIYYPNDTIITIGPVQGDRQYAASMRKTRSSLAMFLPIVCYGSRWMPEPLNRALCTPDFGVDAVQGLLATLQKSVASHLDGPFCFTDIVLPSPETQKYQQDIPRPSLHAADMAVAANTHRKRTDPALDAQVVLAIDNSTYGTNVALVYEEDGVVVRLRQRYMPLGAGEAPGSHSRKQTQAALEDMRRRPFGKPIWDRRLPEKIQTLVLYGDTTNVPTLGAPLEAMFGIRAVRSASRFKPVFASAIAAARSNHEYLREIEFLEPLGGCQEGRKRYSYSGFELLGCDMPSLDNFLQAPRFTVGSNLGRFTVSTCRTSFLSLGNAGQRSPCRPSSSVIQRSSTGHVDDHCDDGVVGCPLANGQDQDGLCRLGLGPAPRLDQTQSGQDQQSQDDHHGPEKFGLLGTAGGFQMGKRAFFGNERE
ncbi:hypothetical protein CCM_08084 [Cordyceps militaris CM01]|uniref:Uncharacterized protein n=1 Tax=Cordyceps militaris (strain CM01) TaxID=983644 RepID=G3JNJ1_CORMM|nr:uncharacterized protein CCM_08084 [Cordyceps militaris CM01]EGX89831.1 hypothetical protein CCM_08084 [Cordyceps militaris CM01]